jgi:hypothetical protein
MMTRTGTVQPSFAAGELSPRMYGRTDFAKYVSGAETIENFIVRPEGGLMRRHGTRFAGEVKEHLKQSRLVPFVFSTVQAYMLEFGHLYMRVWKDYAPVTSSTKTITGISQANPAVVTATAHGLVANDRVVITGVAGMGQVNNPSSSSRTRRRTRSSCKAWTQPLTTPTRPAARPRRSTRSQHPILTCR